MPHIIKFISALLTILTLSACEYLDGGSILGSLPVNERFDDRNNRTNFSAPVVDASKPYNFAVISDTHYYKTNPEYFRKISEKVSENKISFIILLGDITQAGTAAQFRMVKDDLNNLNIPYYPVIGNHDIYNNGYDNYKRVFGRTVYSFDIGGTRFIFTDTANGLLGGGQKDWLTKRLKAHMRIKLVFTHYSPIDDDLQSFTATPEPEESASVIALNDKYDTNCFISGHLHNYRERTVRGTRYLIVNDTASLDNSIVIFTIDGSKVSYKDGTFLIR